MSQFTLFPNDRSPPPPAVPRLIPNPQPRRTRSREQNTLPSQSTPSPPVPSQPSEASPPTVPFQFDFVQTDSSQAQSSNHRSSIAKMPLPDESPAPLRSIFPTYDPQVPLDRQEYGPTQLSPQHIPRAIVSRQSYYEGDEDGSVAEPAAAAAARARSPPMRNNPRNNAFNGPRVVVHNTPPPVIPKTSTTNQLLGFWKAANGWKASSSEGRVYCLKLSQRKDTPVYTFSSDSQPFYSFRMDPTSASAKISLSRYDPHKTFKTSSQWHQALDTKLEEEARKHPPNDGLVASLMPTPAKAMAEQKSSDETAVNTAERECARLVWDQDSSSHWLAHPALAAPFCVSVERCPAWQRTEYTLEHAESNRHLAKLTRDGTGGGWLEVDTGIAAHIEAYYIIDVAVAALMLVAIDDEKNTAYAPAEAFEPPPAIQPVDRGSRSSSRLSKMSGSRKDTKSKKKPRMEEFEIDLESQNDSLGKTKTKNKDADDKLPFVVRVVVKLVKGVFKCFIWVLTVAFKVVGGVFKVCYSCVGSKY